MIMMMNAADAPTLTFFLLLWVGMGMMEDGAVYTFCHYTGNAPHWQKTLSPAKLLLARNLLISLLNRYNRIFLARLGSTDGLFRQFSS